MTFSRRYHQALQSAGGGDRNYRGWWRHLFIQYDRVVHWHSKSLIRRVLFSGRKMEHTFSWSKAEQHIDWMIAGETRIFRSGADKRMRPSHLASKASQSRKIKSLKLIASWFRVTCGDKMWLMTVLIQVGVSFLTGGNGHSFMNYGLEYVNDLNMDR